jgi:hypothetical protein
MPKLFIVGGSDAGISAALRARELAPEWQVTVAVADRYPNFSICGIPYYLSKEVAEADNLTHRRLPTFNTWAWSYCSIIASNRSIPRRKPAGGLFIPLWPALDSASISARLEYRCLTAIRVCASIER